MRLLIRMVAVLAAVSVFGTLWFIAAIAPVGGLRALATSKLGFVTFGGWLIALVAGPVAVVQLWRFRDSGRRAGIILFGYGVAYYIIGLLWLRSPQASVQELFVAIVTFALPLVVLLLPRTRSIFSKRSGASRKKV